MERAHTLARRPAYVDPEMVIAIETWLAAGGVPREASNEFVPGLNVTRHVAWVIAHEPHRKAKPATTRNPRKSSRETISRGDV